MPEPRRRRSAVAVLGLLLAIVLLGAAPASAHSTLVSTDPAQGSQVPVSPAAVTLTFSESVGIAQDSVQVLDPNGVRVDTGAARHRGSDASTVVVDLKPGLAKASYAVLWHVASADTHPVSGSFSFGVGVPAGTVRSAPAGDAAVRAVHWALGALWYLGAAVLIGTAAFVALLWPGGRDRPAVRRLLWTGVAVAGLSVTGLYVIQGPYGQGRDLAAVGQWGLLQDTLNTHAGPLLLERLLLVLLAVPVTFLWPRRLAGGSPRGASPTGTSATRTGATGTGATGAGGTAAGGVSEGAGWQTLVLGVVLALTSALAGHPGQQDPVVLSAGLDAVHFLAAAVWLGGLVCLALAFLPGATPVELAAVLPRWSRLAMAAVAALVATGAIQAWRQIGTVAALTGTEYGKLVLVKVGGLALLLALAELGRRWVRSYAGKAARPARALRESVLAEVGIGVVVLGITASLASTVPARQAYAPPFSATLQATGVDGSAVTVLIDIPDTRPGVQTVHIYTYTTQGQVLPFVEVDGSLLEKSKGLGPVRFVFADTGPGHGTAEGVAVPGEGSWTLTVQVKTDDTTSYAGAVTFPVRAG